MDARLRSLFLCLVLSFCFTACGAANTNKGDATVDILGQLELSELSYSGAQSEAQAASDKAKVAQREADAADAARIKAAQALALVLEQAAKVRESQAREYREKVCKIDPGRCGPPVPAGPAPAPLSEPSVDVKVSFSSFDRLPGSSYPSGWNLEVQGGDQKGGGTLVLIVNNVPKASVLRPVSAEAPVACYRFTEKGVVAIKCPSQ